VAGWWNERQAGKACRETGIIYGGRERQGHRVAEGGGQAREIGGGGLGEGEAHTTRHKGYREAEGGGEGRETEGRGKEREGQGGSGEETHIQRREKRTLGRKGEERGERVGKVSGESSRKCKRRQRTVCV